MDMLAVVVVVPIVIMVLACALERYEALTTRVRPAPRAPRTPTTTATETPAPAAPLRLLPGSRDERAAALDGPTEQLSRAS